MSDFLYLKCDKNGRLIVGFYDIYGTRQERAVELDEIPDFIAKSVFFQRFLSCYGLEIDFKK